MLGASGPSDGLARSRTLSLARSGPCVARPWCALIAALIVAAVRGDLCRRPLRDDDRHAALISPKVAWRSNEQAVDDGLPATRRRRCSSWSTARRPNSPRTARRRLAEALAADKAHFRSVSAPTAAISSRAKGCCSARPPRCSDATAALIKAQPLLGPLAARSLAARGRRRARRRARRGGAAARPSRRHRDGRCARSPRRSTRARRQTGLFLMAEAVRQPAAARRRRRAAG